MNENRSSDDRPGSREAQPWHEADEKSAKDSKGATPIGTHSLTGGGAQVGMPNAKESVERGAERGNGRPDVDRPAEPDPMAEPRANLGEILGRKP